MDQFGYLEIDAIPTSKHDVAKNGSTFQSFRTSDGRRLTVFGGAPIAAGKVVRFCGDASIQQSETTDGHKNAVTIKMNSPMVAKAQVKREAFGLQAVDRPARIFDGVRKAAAAVAAAVGLD